MTPAELDGLIAAPRETEHLEFKEAKAQFDSTKLLRYCAALANEGGGKLVLGVTDKPPRQVVGTAAFLNPGQLVSDVLGRLHFRVSPIEVTHPNGRVLVIEVPSRPPGTPIQLDGTYWMRAGEELVAMTADQLKRIFDEGKPGFLDLPATAALPPEAVVSLLEVQTFFDLQKLPMPTTQEAILARLESERLVRRLLDGWEITNLGAVLLAKDMRAFDSVWRKAPRVIVYRGKNKIEAIRDQVGGKGYAVGFQGLMSYIRGQLPANEVMGQALRTETTMYPDIAVRELVANALIHQDFDETGTGVMVEIYSDRIEITNPGVPLIPTDRFVDEYKSRNERLADLMRRMGICEERSSGIDKVVLSTEEYQLPAPSFRVGDRHTSAVLYAHQDFADMDGNARMRAAYLHACLKYVSNERMTNQSLRERFGLPEPKSAVVSQVIAATVAERLIRLDEASGDSKRYARYVPFWG